MSIIPQLSGRPVVFITGASSGIGAAAVAVFAQAGYDVVAAARRQEKLEVVTRSAAQASPEAKILPLVCDVDFDASVTTAFEAVAEKFGRLDVLVNNAGFGVYGAVSELPVDTFRACMETNYVGVLRCTKAALPLLRKTAAAKPGRYGAAIIMVSSIVGRRAIPKLSAYCASKFALEGLSESLRVELVDQRVSVSVINPGVTETNFTQAARGKRPTGFHSPEHPMSAQTVARVLLRAVTHPRRNQFLTVAGKVAVTLQWLAPRLLDAIFLRVFRKNSS